MNRIKSIDGLRAISIMLVLKGHSVETMPAFLTNNYLFSIISNSMLGVSIFFVISGYLITKLLILERQKTGGINLGYFYIRRVLRIFPVFYLYLLVIIILKVYFIPDIVDHNATFLYAGLYIWNYTIFFDFHPGVKGSWFLGHFWTLAMEEQFYLVWPLAFKLLSGRQNAVKIILIIILLMPFIRVLTYVLLPAGRGAIGIMLPTAGDMILTGCLGALVESQEDFKRLYFKYIQNGYLVGFAFLFLLIVSPVLKYYLKGAFDLTVGISLSNVCILLLLFWSMYVPSGFASFLNSRPMVQTGLLSYSIYVWQQLFLTNHIGSWFNKFPQNLVVVFLVAFVSFNLIEKPILKWKNHFK